MCHMAYLLDYAVRRIDPTDERTAGSTEAKRPGPSSQFSPMTPTPVPIPSRTWTRTGLTENSYVKLDQRHEGC